MNTKNSKSKKKNTKILYEKSQFESKWKNSISSLNSFSQDFMENGREQPKENQKRESL